jgi:prepilin-type N-terminal cleavage/methylation domain-containing protein
MGLSIFFCVKNCKKTKKNYTFFVKNNTFFMKKNAFTLAELVIVIVILVILGTIALINFKWATLSARDSVRISDVTNISNGLFLYNTKSWNFPIPENSISVTYAWNEISKVWNLSTTSLATLWLSWGLVDPQTKDPYPYT